MLELAQPISNGVQTIGPQANGFGLGVNGTADIPFVIEACSSPVDGDWIPLQTNNTARTDLMGFGFHFVALATRTKPTLNASSVTSTQAK